MFGVIAGITWFILDALVITFLSKNIMKFKEDSFLYKYAKRKGL